MSQLAMPNAKGSNPAHLFRYLLLVILLVGTSAAAQGQSNRKWGGEVRAQMGVGGDKLATVAYSDGTDSDLTLGTYFSFTAGPIYSAWTSGGRAIELEALVGFGMWSTGPENTEDRVGLKRMPVELLAFYRFPIVKEDMYLRVGAGATYHVIGGVKGTGSLSNIDVGVSSAPGAILETTFIQGIISGGLRYTIMSSDVDGLGSMSASNVAGFLGISLPR